MHNKGRVALEPILFILASKKLAKISQVPNFGGGRIGPTCFNQNFADRHIHHKIYIQQNVSRVNRAMDFSTLHVLDSPLSSNAWFRPLIGRVVFARLAGVCVVACTTCDRRRLSCWNHLFKLLPVTRSKKRVIRIWTKTPFIPRFHWNNCEKRQMDQVKNDCHAIACAKLD